MNKSLQHRLLLVYSTAISALNYADGMISALPGTRDTFIGDVASQLELEQQELLKEIFGAKGAETGIGEVLDRIVKELGEEYNDSK